MFCGVSILQDESKRICHKFQKPLFTLGDIFISSYLCEYSKTIFVCYVSNVKLSTHQTQTTLFLGNIDGCAILEILIYAFYEQLKIKHLLQLRCALFIAYESFVFIEAAIFLFKWSNACLWVSAAETRVRPEHSSRVIQMPILSVKILHQGWETVSHASIFAEASNAAQF